LIGHILEVSKQADIEQLTELELTASGDHLQALVPEQLGSSVQISPSKQQEMERDKKDKQKLTDKEIEKLEKKKKKGDKLATVSSSKGKPRKGFTDKGWFTNEALNAQLPLGYRLGAACDDGDCFFDALAQCLNQIKNTDTYTVKSLREACHKFYQKNQKLVTDWDLADLNEDTHSKDRYEQHEYYYKIQYTADECNEDFNKDICIWGRPWVEGVMICQELKVKGICVISVSKESETNKLILSYCFRNYKSGQESPDETPVNKEEFQALLEKGDIPVLVNVEDKFHFVPLLKELESEEELGKKKHLDKPQTQSLGRKIEDDKDKGKDKEKDEKSARDLEEDDRIRELIERTRKGDQQARFKLGQICYKEWKKHKGEKDYQDAKDHLTRIKEGKYKLDAEDMLSKLENEHLSWMKGISLGGHEVIADQSTAISSRPQPNLTQPRLILSLDGGGIRGVWEAYLLDALEKYITSKINEHFNDPAAPNPEVRLGECFDLIAGTSTGGIIGLAMRFINPDTNRPRYQVSTILKVYQRLGKYIFSMWISSWATTAVNLIGTPKYSPKNLEQVLEKMFSAVNAKKQGERIVREKVNLSDLPQSTLITTYDAKKEKLKLLKSNVAKTNPNKDFATEDAARATSAAPTYFKPAKIRSIGDKEKIHYFLDGGVAANNPTFHAYVEAQIRLFPGSSFHVISLGTGSSEVGSLHKKKSLGAWAKVIAPVLMNNSSEAMDYFVNQVTEINKDHYTRLQFELPIGQAELDNASEKFIDDLINNARNVIDNKDRYNFRKKGKDKKDKDNFQKFNEIKGVLDHFYEQRDYYVFYPLVKLARTQLRDDDGCIDLSRRYLASDKAMHEIQEAQEDDHLLSGVTTLSYLTDRAMWDVVHGLENLKNHNLLSNVTELNLSGNQLSPGTLTYLNAFNQLESLDLSNIDLDTKGLRGLKDAKFIKDKKLEVFKAYHNPLLSASKSQTIKVLSKMFRGYKDKRLQLIFDLSILIPLVEKSIGSLGEAKTLNTIIEEIINAVNAGQWDPNNLKGEEIRQLRDYCSDRIFDNLDKLLEISSEPQQGSSSDSGLGFLEISDSSGQSKKPKASKKSKRKKNKLSRKAKKIDRKLNQILQDDSKFDESEKVLSNLEPNAQKLFMYIVSLNANKIIIDELVDRLTTHTNYSAEEKKQFKSYIKGLLRTLQTAGLIQIQKKKSIKIKFDVVETYRHTQGFTSQQNIQENELLSSLYDAFSLDLTKL